MTCSPSRERWLLGAASASGARCRTWRGAASGGPAQPSRKTTAFRSSGCRPMHRRSPASTFRGRSTSGRDSIARRQRAHRAHGPHHVHHNAAKSWLAGVRGNGWATCPLTEAGFVRVSCNPSAVRQSVTVLDAISLLDRLRRLESHAFRAMEHSIAALPRGILSRIQGWCRGTAIRAPLRAGRLPA